MAFFNPFCSEDAISNSNYCLLQKADYKTSKPISGQMRQTTEKVASKLSVLMARTDIPKQLFGTTRKRNCNFGVYPQLSSTSATAGLCRDLARFLHEQKERPSPNATFMAVFASPSRLNKEEFEQKVQEQLQLLQKAAEPFYCIPQSEKEKAEKADSTVTFGGKALKVVSIYRNTSAGQLKFDYPMLAFHLQPEATDLPPQQPLKDRKAATLGQNTHPSTELNLQAKAS